MKSTTAPSRSPATRHILAIALTAALGTHSPLVQAEECTLNSGDTSATSSGTGSLACGTNAQAYGQGVTSIGAGAGDSSLGDANTSVGINSGQIVTGFSNTSIGTGSGQYTVGDQNTSLGYSAGFATTGNNNVAIGSYAGNETEGNNNVAIGNFAGQGVTSANNTVAIGQNTLSTVDGGVALGSGSVANAPAGVAGYVPAGATPEQQAAIANTTSTLGAVSVGNADGDQYRQITGVAAGTADSDAVNVSQLKAVSSQAQQDAAAGDARTLRQAQRYADAGDARTLRQARGYTDQMAAETRAYADAGDARTLDAARQHTDAEVGALRKETSAGIAQAAALVPMAPAGDGESTVNVGVASYRGQSAVGLAYARQVGSVVINGGLAFGSGKHRLVRIGAGWRF